MLEFRFNEANQFKKIVDALKDVVKEVNIECDVNGLSVQSMDPTHVALVSLFMPASFFSHYQCGDHNVSLGVNVDILAKMIRPSPNNAPLTLRKTDNDQELQIITEEDDISVSGRHASMKLVDVESERLTIPDCNYAAQIHFPAKQFQTIVRDLHAVAENLKIRITPTTITFDADGDLGRVENSFHKGKGIFNNIANLGWFFQKGDRNDVQQQEFAVRYLLYFAKAAPIADAASISMAEGVPLRVMFEFGGGDGEESGHLAFYLAPKLDE